MSVSMGARLRSAGALVPASCGVVADIGAGHGALAAGLAMRGDARVIATELVGGPLDELLRNLSRWGVAGRVEVRSGPGLSPLLPGEAEGAVVAGAGARTALRIAAEAPSRGVHWLVLQCIQHHQLVEPWLSSRGWTVRTLDSCVQRGRPYTARLVEVRG